MKNFITIFALLLAPVMILAGSIFIDNTGKISIFEGGISTDARLQLFTDPNSADWVMAIVNMGDTNTANPVFKDYGSRNNDMIVGAGSVRPTLVLSTETNSDYLVFDGIDDQAWAADVNNMTFTNASGDIAFSISVWIQTVVTNTFDIFFARREDVSQRMEYELGMNSPGTVRWILHDNNDSNSELCNAGPIEPNKWVHIVGTYNGNDRQILYTNGILAKTNMVGDGAYVNMHNHGIETSVGTDDVGQGGNNHMQGFLFRPVLYSNVLSQADVTELFNETHPFDKPNNETTVNQDP